MELIDMTPVMTDYNIPRPYVVTCSSEYSDKYKAYTVFNNIDDSEGWISKDSEVDGAWICIDFGMKTKISRISIKAGQRNMQGLPRAFSVLGSDDNVSFETLKTIEDQMSWNALETRTFKLGDIYHCRYYKILIKESNGFPYTGFNELKFIYGEGDGVEPTPLSIHKTLKDNLPLSVNVKKEEIHFTEDGGIYISNNGNLVQCGVTRGEFEEVKQSVSDGKGIIATAITDKGVQASGDDTFVVLGDKIRKIETSGNLGINGATDVSVFCGEDLLKGDVVKIVNHDKEFLNITKEGTTPDIIPVGSRVCTFSSDGKYLVMSDKKPTYIAIYKRDGDTFTKLQDPDVLPTGTCEKASFCLDGNYLAVAHSTSPFITIYKRNGDTFTKLQDPDVLPPNTGKGCSFSPDGNYLAIGHMDAPYLTIYKRNEDTFTKLSDPDVLPKPNGNGCSFSPDGNYLAIGHGNSSPFMAIYKRNQDEFIRLPDPDVLPTGMGNGCSFSPDGKYLAVAHGNSPNITIYKRNEDAFTKLQNPDMLPASSAQECSFSQDGNYLAVAHNGHPFITIYKRNGDTFTKLQNPDVLPSNSGNGCSFGSSKNYLATNSVAYPYIHIYRNIETGLRSYKQESDSYGGYMDGIGIVNEDGERDELKIVKKIFSIEELFNMTIEREKNQLKDSKTM